jgi:hypothetical protein
VPAAQVGPEPGDIDLAAAEDSDRFAGGVGEQAPEQVFAGDLGPVAAAAGYRWPIHRRPGLAGQASLPPEASAALEPRRADDQQADAHHWRNTANVSLAAPEAGGPERRQLRRFIV